MIRLIRFELTKLMFRPRTFLCLGLMVVLVSVIFWGLKSEGEQAAGYLLKSLEASFLISGKVVNGYFVVFIILNTLWIHLPVLIVIITGDLFSAELESGTIRLLLTSPVKRSRVALSKFIAALVFVWVFILLWGVVSLGPALALFGGGDLMVFFNGVQILEERDLWWRFVSAFGYAFLGMSAFAVFSVALSFFTRRSLVTILMALGVLVISTLLQTLSATLPTGWNSFLITYHLAQWQLFFLTETDTLALLHSVVWLVVFSGVCVVVAVIRFNRMRITE